MNSPYLDFLRGLLDSWVVPHLLPALAVVGVAFAALFAKTELASK